MVDNSNKRRKEFISEGDIATLLQRYDTMTILKLLQEMAYYAEPKMDWNELVKKTTTGITNAREYQLLWRHLAYRDSLVLVEDGAQLPDDESDMECELEASPAVGVDAVAEAVAHVKVMAASYVPSESDIPEDSMVEAPLTINIPYGLTRGPQEPSDSYGSSRGMNITFPVSLQKAADGLNGSGLASSIASRKRRKKWSAEEDDELHAAVKRRGEGSWVTIAKEEFEGERTAPQLSQRWSAIKRKGDTPNASTQSGLQRTEAQMAANRALSLAVGNRVPSKKLAVGMPPMRSSGSIPGAQPNGGNSSNSLQGQQQSQSTGQGLARAAASVPTAKSRVTTKKATANSTSRAELMVTANSVAAAACMSGLGTASTVPKVEPGKNVVPASVLKVEPGKNAVPASVPKVEPGKNAVPASAPKVEPTKPASAASLPPISGIPPALNPEPVKAASAASLPQPSGIPPALNAEPVKATSAASLPPISGIPPALNAKPVKAALAASSAQPSGIPPALNAEPVKTTSAASLPRTSAAPNAEPVKTASAASLPHPSGRSSVPNAEPVKTASGAPLARPSSIISSLKAEPVKTASATSLPRQPGIIPPLRAEPVRTAPAASLPRQSGIIPPLKAEPVKFASAVSLPPPSAPNAEPVKSIGAAATKTQAVGSLSIRHTVNGSPNHMVSSLPSNKPSSMTPLSKGPTIPMTSISSGFASSRFVPPLRVTAATVTPQKPSAGATQKPNAGAAVTATCKPVGVQKEQTQGKGARPVVTSTLQPNKTVSTNSVVSTGILAAAKVETPPSNMPKKTQVLQTEVVSHTDKSLLAKPPVKEIGTAASPIIIAEAESKPKDEASKGKSPDVAPVTGLKGL